MKCLKPMKYPITGAVEHPKTLAGRLHGMGVAFPGREFLEVAGSLVGPQAPPIAILLTVTRRTMKNNWDVKLQHVMTIHNIPLVIHNWDDSL